MLSELLPKPIKVFGARQLLVQNAHEGVEHLGADRVVDGFVLLEVHVGAGHATSPLLEDVVRKFFDLFLIAQPILVINILAFIFLK